MENLIIEPSVKTPTINFYADNGILEIKGKSIPENSISSSSSSYIQVTVTVLLQ